MNHNRSTILVVAVTAAAGLGLMTHIATAESATPELLSDALPHMYNGSADILLPEPWPVVTQQRLVVVDTDLTYNTIQHTVKPDWLGKKIQYQVFELLWGQKLFSSPAAVVMPDSLEPPSNLRYDVSYEEGAGNVVTISWDHSPLFRNYIVELHSEDGWTRMSKTAENHTTAYAQPGEHKFRVYSHINGAMSTPAEIAVSVPPG